MAGNYIDALRNIKILSCTITGNVSNAKGGGLNIRNVAVENCVIMGNSTTNNDGGGVWGTNINIRNCLIAKIQPRPMPAGFISTVAGP